MVRTRFAPSPTGFLHIGSLRTALYAYALAKHEKGDFILRIEDTDQKREVSGATEALQATLRKFGLNWDEYHLQSDRQKTGVYQKAAEKLIRNDHAFFCLCPAKNAKEQGYSVEVRDPCRDKKLSSGAVKLKAPDSQTVSYHDFVHKKEISWDTNTVYDATLLKSDGFPTYHLAAVVDDLEMNISHVLRGHDWLPSTPIHLLVFDYLGNHRPQIGHLSDILSATTGKKLSKRRDSVFIENFIEQGYLPEALLNFILLLGWAPKDNRELFTLSEFVEYFNIDGFQEANPRFLENKLNWFNGHYIRQKSDAELLQLIKPYLPEITLEIIPLIKDRIATLAESKNLASFFFSRPQLQSVNADHLQFAIDNYDRLIKGELSEEIKSKGWKTGDFFMSLRLAVCGSKITPPLTDSMLILGKEEVIARLKSAHGQK